MRTLVVLMLSATLFAADLPRRANAAIEQYDNAEVTLGSVALRDGTLLRTILTRPRRASGKLPGLLFVGWLSCDSVEAFPDGDGFAQVIRRVVDRSGFITLRVDKPGVGDSQGDCARTDFDTELEAYRAAFQQLLVTEGVDRNRIFVLGMSNGGGFAPLVAQATPVAGYVSLSGWGRTWYEHMLEHERVRLGLSGKSPEEITSELQQFATFYDEYLNARRTPGEVLASHAAFRPIWYDEADNQYGRPAAFYQQLQALNLAAAWSRVSAPVLVARGENDFIMSHNDAVAIADAVNRSHAGAAIYLERPHMTHGFRLVSTMRDAFAGKSGPLDEELVTAIVQFLRQHVK